MISQPPNLPSFWGANSWGRSLMQPWPLHCNVSINASDIEPMVHFRKKQMSFSKSLQSLFLQDSHSVALMHLLPDLTTMPILRIYFVKQMCSLHRNRKNNKLKKKKVFSCALLKVALLGWISLCFQLEHSVFSWWEIAGNTSYTKPLFFLKSILIKNYSLLPGLCNVH